MSLAIAGSWREPPSGVDRGGRPGARQPSTDEPGTVHALARLVGEQTRSLLSSGSTLGPDRDSSVSRQDKSLVLNPEHQCFARDWAQVLHALREVNELLAIVLHPRQQRRNRRSWQRRAGAVMQDDGQDQESECERQR